MHHTLLLVGLPFLLIIIFSIKSILKIYKGENNQLFYEVGIVIFCFILIMQYSIPPDRVIVTP